MRDSSVDLASNFGHRPPWTMPDFALWRGDVAALLPASAVATLLVARRAAAALVEPPDVAVAAGFAAAMLLAVATAALLRPSPAGRAVVIFVVLPAASAALTFREASPLATLLVWLPPLACAAVFALLPRANRAALAKGSRASPKLASTESTVAVSRRYFDVAGRDCLEATLRGEVPAGSRVAVIHAAFHPPFAVTPEIDAAPTDDKANVTRDVEVRTTTLLPYGARFEIKLPTTATTPRFVRLRLKARERGTDGQS